MKTNIPIGQQIQQMRLKAGLTQKGLAEIIGLNHRSISNIEQGIKNPSMPTLEKIAAAIHCDIRMFLVRKK
jgi:transcriptional regulator with XRE-family HTH domain